MSAEIASRRCFLASASGATALAFMAPSKDQHRCHGEDHTTCSRGFRKDLGILEQHKKAKSKKGLQDEFYKWALGKADPHGDRRC